MGIIAWAILVPTPESYSLKKETKLQLNSIHNVKGRNGGTLFRCYPGPCQVLRKVVNEYFCLHQQEAMPSLKEVALEILPCLTFCYDNLK
ncbi:protein of unknown function DUF1995 [Dillenia turbinata]|uniref:DUF1995 domain-containing protein n=1 Tax=Dillenia turbinata TaxID=194707 RepID=A0AAN8VWM9_9MAGN